VFGRHGRPVRAASAASSVVSNFELFGVIYVRESA
jgi:hypothetical protein